MTMITRATRGATISFSFSFNDKNGELVTPPGAELDLSYLVNGTQTSQTLPLTNDGNGNWQVDWDSSVADADQVYWHVRSTGASENAAEDGDFRLRANDANPDPE